MGYNKKEIKIISSADGLKKNPFKKGKLKKFTSNPDAGVNKLMLPNPNYHTARGMTFLPRKQEGGPLDYPGYIPAGQYPLFQNPDGTYSNEVSMGLNIDGKEMLLPSFWDGSRHTSEETMERFKQTGEHLGAFNSVEDSERGAHLREFMNNDILPYKQKGGWLDKYDDGGVHETQNKPNITSEYKPKTKEEELFRRKMFNDSLELAKQTRATDWIYQNTNKLNKVEYDSLSNLESTYPQYSFIHSQYDEDKKNKNVGEFKDYVQEYHLGRNIPGIKGQVVDKYTEKSITGRDLSVGLAKDDAFYDSELEKSPKGFTDKQGRIHTFDNMGDSSNRDLMENVYDPQTETGRTYGIYDNKRTLINVENKHIKPTESLYRGNVKKQIHSELSLGSSSTGWYDATKPKPKFKGTSNEKYISYNHELERKDLTPFPTQKILKADADAPQGEVMNIHNYIKHNKPKEKPILPQIPYQPKEQIKPTSEYTYSDTNGISLYNTKTGKQMWFTSKEERAKHPGFTGAVPQKKYGGWLDKYQNAGAVTDSIAQKGGAQTPEEWEKEIRNVEHQIGNPSTWTLDSHKMLQDKLNEYKAWRENTPEGKAVVDYHNEPNEYIVPLPEQLKDPKMNYEKDLISKVLMNRNKDKDFVQRAYAVGEYPNSNMFVQPDANQFGDKNSHLMSYGEDDNGQSYMFPAVMNPNREMVRVPNQYAEYISSKGYKNATGINKKYQDGGNINDNEGYRASNLRNFTDKKIIDSNWIDTNNMSVPAVMANGQMLFNNTGTHYIPGKKVTEYPVMQEGGSTDTRSVAQMWQETTGLPWSAARAMGLSDGSYESNMKIREGLRRGDYDNILQNMSYEEQQSLSRPHPQTNKKQVNKVFEQKKQVKSVVPSAPISIPTKTTGLNKVAVPSKVISSVPSVAPISKVPVKVQPSAPTTPSEPFIWMKESSSVKKVKPVIPAVKPVTPISKIIPPARVEPSPVLGEYLQNAKGNKPGFEKKLQMPITEPNYEYPIFPKPEKKLPIWAHDMSPKPTEQLPVKSGIYIDKGKNIAYVIGENGEQITFPVLTGQNREGNIGDTHYDEVYQIPKKERVTAEGFYMLEPQQDISKLPPEERKAMMDEYNGKFRNLKTIIGPNGEPKARTENTGFHQTAFMSNENYDERVKAYEALDPRARDLSYGCTNAEECDIDYVNKIMPGADTVMVFDSKNNPNLDKLLRQKFVKKQQDYQYPIATGKYEQPIWSELRQTNSEPPLSLSVNQSFQLGGWLDKYQDAGEVTLSKKDIYGNPITMSAEYSDNDRAYYEPKTNTTYLDKDVKNMNKDQFNRLIAHENRHAWQYDNDRTNFDITHNTEGANYARMLKKPSMISTDEVWNAYHDRKNREVNEDIKSFVNKNKSFQFTPGDLIYDKNIDLQQYTNPYSKEGEASLYEWTGKTPEQYRSGGTLNKYDDGGIVSEIWEQQTGTPWSEAKRQGLTDGSYKLNMKLRTKLLKQAPTQIMPEPVAKKDSRMQLPMQYNNSNETTNQPLSRFELEQQIKESSKGKTDKELLQDIVQENINTPRQTIQPDRRGLQQKKEDDIKTKRIESKIENPWTSNPFGTIASVLGNFEHMQPEDVARTDADPIESLKWAAGTMGNAVLNEIGGKAISKLAKKIPIKVRDVKYKNSLNIGYGTNKQTFNNSVEWKKAFDAERASGIERPLMKKEIDFLNQEIKDRGILEIDRSHPLDPRPSIMKKGIVPEDYNIPKVAKEFVPNLLYGDALSKYTMGAGRENAFNQYLGLPTTNSIYRIHPESFTKGNEIVYTVPHNKLKKLKFEGRRELSKTNFEELNIAKKSLTDNSKAFHKEAYDKLSKWYDKKDLGLKKDFKYDLKNPIYGVDANPGAMSGIKGDVTYISDIDSYIGAHGNAYWEVKDLPNKSQSWKMVDTWDINPFSRIKKAPKFIKDLDVAKAIGAKNFKVNLDYRVTPKGSAKPLVPNENITAPSGWLNKYK